MIPASSETPLEGRPVSEVPARMSAVWELGRHGFSQLICSQAIRRSFCALLLTLPALAEDVFTSRRERLLQELQTKGIRNQRVLQAIRATPRHLFVPEEVRSWAYIDQALPIGRGQTISQPYVVALMTELLEPAETNRVLEIGAGSGYQAAVLSRLVKHVYTIEIVPELAESARNTLTANGYRNVTVRRADGHQGWVEQAPFDRVIITAATPEIPPALLAQLRPGGKLVAPIGPVDSYQN